jgi:Cu+-exporting ATPase
VGDDVIGGTLNGTGAIVMEAREVGADTLLARIVARVSEALRSRAPVQRTADAVASSFVPAVLGAAVVAFVAWATWGPRPALAYALVAAVSVVIIACPCALGLATPMSIAVAVGKGAGIGVLVSAAGALEALERVTVLVLDKTGTLTEGRPRVTAVVTRASTTRSEAEIVSLAAGLERLSEHPLAAAIVAAARERSGEPAAATDFAALAGKGVTGTSGGHHVAVGNARLMADLGIPLGELETDAATLRAGGATALFVAVDGAAAAVIALADPIKATSAAALRDLRAGGLRIVMLTGDDAATAGAVALALAIDDVRAGVSPDEKFGVIEALRAAGGIVAMAGDGVNDAPALAAADVGIAMGTGTDVAIASAGITLVNGDLRGLVRARNLSRATMRNIRENLAFAFAYNIIGIPIAAGVLYPAFGLLLSPMIAALAMSLSSVSVIANALRLRSAKI